MKVFYPGWEIKGSVLAFPHAWQRPAKTEEWVYERCLLDLPVNRYAQMLCFPWATLIDLQRRGKWAKAQFFLDALHWTPPKSTLIRATVMQHIWAKDIFPALERLGITDVFWAHATKNETRIGKIRIHPFPLYPVCCAESEQDSNEWVGPAERRYLYSFIGAYEPSLYLSKARQWIFNLPACEEAVVVRRTKWHFEDAVYGDQIEGAAQSDEMIKAQSDRKRQYKEVLNQSIFSLCPSGAGPNTIRLWESIRLGAIPVVISDQCLLPGDVTLWRRASVLIPETQNAVQAIPSTLAKLVDSPLALLNYRRALIELAESFTLQRLPENIRTIFDHRNLSNIISNI
jgi:hypothetical protein